LAPIDLALEIWILKLLSYSMSKKLLIVEDEPSLANMYRLQLELGGFEVFVARDGEIGLKLIREHRPDLVLLDIVMPKMDGLTVLKTLRATKNYKNTLICFLSNLDQPSDVREGLSHGADYYFTKASLSPKQLLEKVDNILSGREAKKMYGY